MTNKTNKQFDESALDPMAYIARSLKKNPDAFQAFELSDLRVLRESFGKKIEKFEDIIEQVRIILHIDLIPLPLTRLGFKQIC